MGTFLEHIEEKSIPYIWNCLSLSRVMFYFNVSTYDTDTNAMSVFLFALTFVVEWIM